MGGCGGGGQTAHICASWRSQGFWGSHSLQGVLLLAKNLANEVDISLPWTRPAGCPQRPEAIGLPVRGGRPPLQQRKA